MINDVLHHIENRAAYLNRKPAEVLEEAGGRYLATRRLKQLAQRGEERAQAVGIREEDVPRLVDEIRQENRVGGR